LIFPSSPLPFLSTHPLLTVSNVKSAASSFRPRSVSRHGNKYLVP
jgi:hypothetical protein